MDGVIDLDTIVRREVADYVSPSPNSKMFFLENTEHHAYAAVAVPNTNVTTVRVVVMARIVQGCVVVESDITDRPLYEALEQAGIRREQIILAYEGEQVPTV